jgi:hypothetical protein
MKLNKKLFYSLPILLGAYLIYRQFAIRKDGNSDAPLPTPPTPPSPTPLGTSSDYPLRKGSRNETVQALQTLLNTALKGQGKTLLTPDGIFGTKTETALFELTNNKSINSASEFESIKKQLTQTSELSSNLDWAWKLVDAYNSGLYNSLVVKSTIRLYKVQKNFLGVWITSSRPEIVTMPPRNYSLKDYALRAATNNGDLRIEITKGELAGMYLTEKGTNLKNIDIV